MTISVVVPTYNRPRLLRRGLEALARQTLPTDRFEVIVVDDGSSEPAGEAAAGVDGRLDLRVLRKTRGGLASARNHGAAAASGDLLLFLDDDIEPCAEFLEVHLEVHRRQEGAVALGSLPYPQDLHLTPFLYYLERVRHYDLFLRYGSADRIPLPPVNGNSSLPRRCFEEAGGYDLEFSTYGGEDTELGYRLRLAGLRFVYAPRARGYHHHLKNFEDYKRDMYSSGRTLAALARRHPETFSRANLDIVAGAVRGLPPEKKLKRILFGALYRAPWGVKALDRVIASTQGFGWRRSLYPFYLLVAHYHYGRGVLDGIR